MDIPTSFAIQIGIAIIFGLALFMMVFVLSEKHIVGILVILLPFQFVDSGYGSLNMALTYMAAFGMLLRGKVRMTPLLGVVILIAFAYLLSLSQAPRGTYRDHGFYLITVFSGFALFYLVYNYFRQSNDLQYFIKLLLIMNFLVAGYSVLLIFVGTERVVFFGIDELSLATNRAKANSHQRLQGTFGSAGVNASFFALQILIMAYVLLNEQRKFNKFLIVAMIGINFGLMVGTGSRGSFLSLVGGSILFAWLFRRQIGVTRIIKSVAIIVPLFIAMSFVMINYTSYGSLFTRLADTEIDDSGIPETRSLVVALTLEKIPEAMVLGHGPRLKLMDETRYVPGYKPLGGYPHNLVLYLLYTVGFMGLFAWSVWFFVLSKRLYQSRRHRTGDWYLDNLPTMGVLIVVVFLVDQIKIEFLRANLGDIQHYYFFLWGALIAFADNKRQKLNALKVSRVDS